MVLSPTETYVATLFLAVTLSIFGRKMYLRLRYLFAAKGVERRWDHIPTRIKNFVVYGIFQRKVAREWYAGVLHSFIFWAFIILGTSVVEITAQAYAPGWRVPTPTIAGFSLSGPLYLAQEVIAVLAAIGVGMALYRRYVIRPKKLMHEGMRDATIVLFFILGIVTSLLLYNAADIAVGTASLPEWKPISSALAAVPGVVLGATWWRAFWWTHVLLLFSFLAYVPHSKHMHIIFAIVNTFFMDLTPKGTLKKVDLEKTQTFGVDRVEQLSWRQLLDGYACTECGRCTDACPANATGKPLDPMRIITNMRDTLDEQGAAIVRGDVAGLPDMFQTVHSKDGIWACTTCYACVYECPVMNEHVPKIIEMRRHMVLTQGEMPPETMEAMRKIEQNYNPWGIGWDQRARWADGLGVKTLSDALASKDAIDVLYWVGCAASFDDRNQKVAKAFARILQKAGVRFAILGPEEKCTGDPARRLGNEYLAQAMIMGNVETLNRYGVTRIVATCPHCFNTLKNEYPDFGGKYEVVHHSQFLRDLIDAGRLTPTKDVLQFLTYHDPCYLGRYNGLFEEPREVLYRIPGVRVVEMSRAREHGFCCGAGGARMWMEERIGEKVNHRRLSHIEETQANAVATACPYCLIMLDDAAKTKDREDIRRFDIAELLERSL
ncbi:MAG: (Fe-S)-binding protein [Methanobacteriota archaeon]|nr:MAG: (Fe-S)-binding protein [Euryarchaeota archaeon]